MAHDDLTDADLFDAAVCYSLRKGKLKAESDADPAKSRSTGMTFVLATVENRVIDRIPLDKLYQEAKKMQRDLAAIQRERVLAAGKRINNENMQPDEESKSLSPQEFDRAVQYAHAYGKDLKKQLPSLENSASTKAKIVLRDVTGNEILELNGNFFDQNVAIAWARSCGYPVPRRPNGLLSMLLIIIGFIIFIIPGVAILGLIIFIIPGVAILIWVAYRGQAYQRDINALVARWVDAGKPEPGIKTNVEAKVEMIQSTSSVTTQLEEYAKMLEQGLVSPEEHEALRKKALGL